MSEYKIVYLQVDLWPIVYIHIGIRTPQGHASGEDTMNSANNYLITYGDRRVQRPQCQHIPPVT